MNQFVAYYFKAGKVVAIASMQADPVVTKVSELLRLGLAPSAEEIKAGRVWKIYLKVLFTKMFTLLQDPLTIDTSSLATRPKII